MKTIEHSGLYSVIDKEWLLMCEVLLSLPVVIWISGPLRKKNIGEMKYSCVAWVMHVDLYLNVLKIQRWYIQARNSLALIFPWHVSSFIWNQLNWNPLGLWKGEKALFQKISPIIRYSAIKYWEKICISGKIKIMRVSFYSTVWEVLLWCLLFSLSNSFFPFNKISAYRAVYVINKF